MTTTNEHSEQKHKNFDEAILFVRNKGYSEASELRDHFNIGHNSVGILIDQLENAGIILPFTGSKKRGIKPIELPPQEVEAKFIEWYGEDRWKYARKTGGVSIETIEQYAEHLHASRLRSYQGWEEDDECIKLTEMDEFLDANKVQIAGIKGDYFHRHIVIAYANMRAGLSYRLRLSEVAPELKRLEQKAKYWETEAGVYSSALSNSAKENESLRDQLKAAQDGVDPGEFAEFWKRFNIATDGTGGYYDTHDESVRVNDINEALQLFTEQKQKKAP